MMVSGEEGRRPEQRGVLTEIVGAILSGLGRGLMRIVWLAGFAGLVAAGGALGLTATTGTPFLAGFIGILVLIAAIVVIFFLLSDADI